MIRVISVAVLLTLTACGGHGGGSRNTGILAGGGATALGYEWKVGDKLFDLIVGDEERAKQSATSVPPPPAPVPECKP